MKLYYFHQSKAVFEAYDSFTAIASSPDEAWEAFQNKMKKTDPDGYEWIKDRFVYRVEEYPLDEPVVIPHYS